MEKAAKPTKKDGPSLKNLSTRG